MYTQKALIAAKFLFDFDLSITNGIVSSISHFLMKLFLSPLLMVYIFRNLLNFARVCSNVSDFNNRNQFLTAKLLKQGYRYHKLC